MSLHMQSLPLESMNIIEHLSNNYISFDTHFKKHIYTFWHYV